MISMLRRFAAAAVATFAVALPASASTFSTDYTDLWWNPAESGWGVNVIQQYNTLFVTLFVYGADGTNRWFVASSLTGSQNTYSGQLYQTSGPAFSAPFNPGAVVGTPVGSMTFTFTSPYTASLTYTVNGVTVNKTVQRQSFKDNVLAGNYIGGMTAIASACGNAANNGAALIAGDFTVAQSGLSVSIVVDWFANNATASRCTYTGTLATQGRLGTLAGNWSCTGGANNSGTFNMGEVDASANGLNATFSGRDQFCTYTGRFGGVRDVP